MKDLSISGILFLIGIVGAVLVGIIDTFAAVNLAWTALLFVIVGILIGLMNIKVKEAVPFMVAALILGGGALVLAQVPAIGTLLQNIVEKIGSVALPAGIVVAVVTIWKTAK